MIPDAILTHAACLFSTNKVAKFIASSLDSTVERIEIKDMFEEKYNIKLKRKVFSLLKYSLSIYQATLSYSFVAFTLLFILFDYSEAQTSDQQLTIKLREDYDRILSSFKLSGTNFPKLHIDVRSLDNGSAIFQRDHEEFIPIASVQKLLLSYAVLKKLGPDYKFPTEFFTDYLPTDSDPRIDVAGGMEKKVEVPTRSLGNLFVRGYGDPTMQHSDFYEIVHQLKARGLNGIEDLILDTSLFLEERAPTGFESYKAANTALPLEFNTYRIQIRPNPAGQKAGVLLSQGLEEIQILNKVTSFSSIGNSIEINQSPASADLWQERPIGFKNRFQVLSSPKYKILLDGRIGQKSEIYEKYLSHPAPTSYFGESFKQSLLQEGIKIYGSIKQGVTSSTAKSIFVRESKSIGEILHAINKYSSNFTAGQLVFSLGQNEEGIFDYNLGLSELNKILSEIEGYPKGGKIIDGSGLSDQNRVSLEQVITVLKKASIDPVIGPVFISSLSRVGASGTLKNRKLLDSRAPVYTSVFKEEKERVGFIWGKTGTIDNVSGIAGYATSKLGEKLVYAITISGLETKDEAVKIEDSLLETIIGISE